MKPNQQGITLQTVILAGVLTLASTGAAILIYNIIADRSSNIEGVNTDFLVPIGFEPRPLDPPGFNPVTPERFVPNEPADEDSDESAGAEITDDEDECIFLFRKYADISTGNYFANLCVLTSRFASTFNDISHTCAVHTDGTISCWGYGEQGQLGDGNFYEGAAKFVENPVKVEGISDALSVSTGSHHTCAVHTDTTISCWGEGFLNVLGTTFEHNFNSPYKILNRDGSPRTGFKKVSAGERFTCALKEDGRITCWGFGLSGQLGNGLVNEPIHPGEGTLNPDEIFKEVSGITNAVDITTGGDHACALLDDGTIKCWGGLESVFTSSLEGGNQLLYQGNFGKLGNNDDKTQFAPVSVVDEASQIMNGFTAVSAGDFHTCGIRENDVYCWGEFKGITGGPGYDSLTLTPKRVTDFNVFQKFRTISLQETAMASAISSSRDGVCAIVREGDNAGNVIRCWGAFSEYPQRFPVDSAVVYFSDVFTISDIENPVSLDGSSGQFCALSEGGNVNCANYRINQETTTTRLLTNVMALGSD